MAEQDIGRRVLDWYALHGRQLPFRGTKDPYEVLVSEVMLQQTRAQVVAQRYPQFLDRFPDVHALAAASVDEVMKAWEGLGYYRRARNLHAAAKHIAEHCAGVVPDEMDALLAVPGVGSYTAGAVLAIAYDRPEPAVDANVVRIVSRVLRLTAVSGSAASRRAITDQLQTWMPHEAPGDFAQALMDIGSGICTVRAPLCGECPLAEDCRAATAGDQEQYPVQKKAAPRRIEQLCAICLSDGDRMALERRPEGGLLANLYGPPLLSGCPEPAALREQISEMGFTVRTLRPGPEWTHTFTHVQWQLTSWVADVKTATGAPQDLTWADRQMLGNDVAIPTAFRRIIDFWQKTCGTEDEVGAYLSVGVHASCPDTDGVVESITHC